MKTIWKFPLEVVRRQTVKVPTGFKTRHVAEQNGIPCVWIEVDPDDAIWVPIVFYVIGTGHPLPPDEEGAIYCGSTGTTRGGFVWHVYLAAP